MRSIGTMFLWHIELAVIAGAYAGAAAVTALTSQPPHACSGDLAAALAIAAGSVAVLALHLAVACTPKRAGVSDARHADLSLALVALVAFVTLAYVLRDLPAMRVPCAPVSLACLAALNVLALIAAFTASSVGAVVPMFLTSDALAVGGCVIFALLHKLEAEPGAAAVTDALGSGFLRPLMPAAVWVGSVLSVPISAMLSPLTAGLDAEVMASVLNVQVAVLVVAPITLLLTCAALIEDILLSTWLFSSADPRWAAAPRAAALGVTFVYFVFFVAGAGAAVVSKTAGTVAMGALGASCVLRFAGIVSLLLGYEQPRQHTKEKND